MSHRFCSGLILFAVLWSSVAAAEQPQAIDCLATELLPASIIAYAEAPALGDVVDLLLQHPLRPRLESLPAYQAVIKSDDVGKLQQGITLFEGSMGQPWPQAIATLTDGGVTVAIDGASSGFVVLVKSSDTDKLIRLRGLLLAIRQMQQGKDWVLKQGDYRGFTAYAFNDNLKMALLDHWLVITNKSDLGKAIIDHYLDRPQSSLHTSKQFQLAVSDMQSPDAEKPAVAAFIDITAIREAGIARDLYNEKTENPVAELLLGGVLANLRHTPYLTATLSIHQQRLQFQLTTPHHRVWEPPREYFFGAPELATAPPLLMVQDRLFAVSAHRDLSQMWLRAGDLLNEKANDGLAKADTQLTTFFSGRDFGEDILGSLESDVQLVGRRHDFKGVLPLPAIKLPAFAVQFRMKAPEETKSELRRVFQSFVGFLNVVGAMEGQPQLDLGMESIGEAQLIFASYVPERDERESITAPIQFNFSPTLAFAGDRMILSSSKSLAKELVNLSATTTKDTESANTKATIAAATLQQILQDNRAQLVANNMLEKGSGKEAAEGEVGLLLELISYLHAAAVDLVVTEDELKLVAEVKFVGVE